VVNESVPAFLFVVKTLFLFGFDNQVPGSYDYQKKEHGNEKVRRCQQYERTHHGNADDTCHPSEEPASDAFELKWFL
jgi:hypothetical protein